MRLSVLWMLLIALAGMSPAQAQTYFWNANGTSSPAAGGAGTWNTSSVRWREATDTGAAVAWPTTGTGTAAAIFAGTSGTVTVSGSVEANGLTFNTTSYTLSTGTIALVGTTPTISSTVAAATISATLGGSAGLVKSGVGGLTLSGANAFSGPVNVSAGTLVVASAGGLGASTSAAVAGTLSFSSASALAWSGSTSGAGTITKAGNGNVSLTLGNGSTMGEINTQVTSGTLSLATAAPTASVTLARMRGALNGRIAITSGTWNVDNVGQNTTGVQMRSTLTISNASVLLTAGRYMNGTFVVADGGVFRMVGTDRFAFGNEQNSGSPSFEIGAGGMLDVYSCSFGTGIGGAAAGSTTLLKQTGGTAMFGVTDGANTSNRNLNLSVGSGTPTTNTKTAYDLSGGTLAVRGTLSGGTNTGVITNFNFRGGVLAVNAYTATNIGYSTNTADPFANSTDVGTLVNRGGTLAPGGLGTAGRTTITGNYRVDSGAFAVDIGGTTQGNAFQNGAGSYDFVTVTNGSAALGGSLAVSLIGGYTPTVSNTTTLFNVANSTGSGAALSGGFTNVVVAASGNSRIVLADGLASLLVATNTTAAAASVGGLAGVPARTVSLGGYQTANGYAGAGTAWDAANAGSWTTFDPGSTSSPATVASGAIARFADDTASTGSIDVSLASTRNVRGIQFTSSATGASARSYTISQGGGGGIVLDNAGAAVAIADSSAAGNANAIAVPLTLAGDLAASVTDAATSLTLSGGISGAGRGLTKTGAGALVLGGSSSYTGATAVNAGTLTIGSGGSVNSTSGLSVAAGARLVYNGATPLSVSPLLAGSGASSRAILGGSGTIASAVTLDNLGDTLSPGNSPGILSFGTSQAWSSYSYDWEVNDFTGATAGTAFDQVSIAGGLTLSGSFGSFQLNLLSLTAANDPGAVPNFSETSRSWVILTASGSISGFDPTHWSINPSGFVNPTAGAWSLEQSQSGTDLVLMYTAVVPEPGTLALALVGVAGIFVACRRRRATAAKVVD